MKKIQGAASDGDAYESNDVEGIWTAGINLPFRPESIFNHTSKNPVWSSRIECHGESKEDAEELRDAVLAWIAPPAESQPQGVGAVGECFCDRAGLGVRGVSCGDCPRDYTTPAVQIAAPGDVERLQRAYWLGWRNSAAWADRKDLWADRDSKAYTQERDDDLGTLSAALRSQGQADAVDVEVLRAFERKFWQAVKLTDSRDFDHDVCKEVRDFRDTIAAIAQQANKEQPPNTELSRPAEPATETCTYR